MVGSQYLWTSVSSGKVLSSSPTSFSASALSPARAKASAAIGLHLVVWGQLHCCIGIGARLLPVSRFHFAQRRRYLICCGSLLGIVVLG